MDHLRYHPTPKEIITENWPPTGLGSSLPSSLPSQLPKELPSKQQSEVSQTLPTEKERGKGKGNRRGRGILPSALGSRSPPSSVSLALLDNFPKAFGRKPNSRELAYLRDIEKEISAAGATAKQICDAFK
ncbi:unnamed protein product, partial [marine sediment metagenome]